MLRYSKWIFGCLGVLLLLILLGAGLIYGLGARQLNRTYLLPDENVRVLTDEEAIERGKHLVNDLMGCTDCHGEDLRGQLLYDFPLFGQISASNLTSGAGGVGKAYRDADWERAIRHGIGPNGKPLVYVMSSFYQDLGDEDLAAMLTYLKDLPAVDNELPPTTVGPLGRLYILLDPSLVPATVIDHNQAHPQPPPPGVSAEYGKYLAAACMICHGPDFTGGLSVSAGLNLTPGGDLVNWTEDDFIRTIRTGQTPDGRYLDWDAMPIERISRLTRDELRAIWSFLQTLPAVSKEN